MDQSSLPQLQTQQPYLTDPPPYLDHPAILDNSSTPTALPQHKQSLKTLQSTLNLMIVETGKTIRSAVIRRNRNVDENTQRAAFQADAEKLRLVLAGTIPPFHNALDEMEAEIVRARAIIGRDLRALRAKNSMSGPERVVEETKTMNKEIEAAANAMAQSSEVHAPATIDAIHGHHANDVIDLITNSDMAVDDRGTGSGSIQAGHDITAAMAAAETHLHIPSSSHTLEELRVNNNIMAGDMQQDIHFPNTAGGGQAPPHRPHSQPHTPAPSMAQVRQMQIMQQRQQQQQHQQAIQAQQQRQVQAQQTPHTPMQQGRTMPEDNIAFGALPGSTTNSPKKLTPNKPGPGQVFLSPASHEVVTQQGGLNIAPESLPLLPEHMRTQMAQVHTQAVLEAKGMPAGGQGNQPHMHPEFFLEDTPSAGHTQTNTPHFDNQQTSQPQQQQQQQQNTSQPQQNQHTLASPYEPQQPQMQQQNQNQQNQNQQQQQQQPPSASHDEMNFDAMFSADGTMNQDAAEADINFDDFFNDIGGDTSTTQNPTNNATTSGTNAQIGSLEGANETGAADFDLASLGLEHDAKAMGGISAGDMANATTITDLGMMSGAGGGGVGLGLSMLEGLECYANQATDEDAMDGLDFEGGGDLTMHDDGTINLYGHGGGQQQQQQGNSNLNANANANNMGFGSGNASGGAGGAGEFSMSNEDLDAALNMSMDQSTSFDDLLDNMDFGGTGEGGDAGGGGTSEFDDAFFGM